MPRNPSLSTVAYSFGPGPVTPAVRMLLYVEHRHVRRLARSFRAIVDMAGSDSRAGHRGVLVVAAGDLHVPARAIARRTSCSTCSSSGCSAWSWSGCGDEVLRQVLLRHGHRRGAAVGARRRCCRSRRPARPTTRTSSARPARSTACCSPTRCTFPNRPILMFLFFPVPAKYFVMILGAIAFLIVDRRQRDRRRDGAPRRARRRLHLPAGRTRRADAPRSSTAI